MNKVIIGLLVVAALLVGAFGGFYFERSRATVKMDVVKMAMQKQIDTAKMMAQKNAMMETSPIAMAKAGYVTDTKGMTLYTFDKDTASQSTCYDKCAQTWPPYVVSGTVPTTLPAHIGTTKRTDGSVEYTWNTMPLYYYIGDKKSGDTTGDGVGGVWHLAK